MICCDTCGGEPRDLEDLAVFVSQLAALGVPARIQVGSIPAGLGRNLRFELAPYQVDRPLTAEDSVVLLAAQRLGDDRLVALRRLAQAPVPVLAWGSFASRQAILGARARIAYAFGREPEMRDLAEAAPGELGLAGGAPILALPRRSPQGALPRVLLVSPDLDDGRQGAALVALSLSRRFRLAVLTDGRAKQAWQAAQGADLPVYHYGEVLPADLAERVEICVSFTPPEGNYRLQSLLANLALSGAALIDATPRHALSGAGDAFLRGPQDLATLAAFLTDEILPNRGDLGARAAASRLASRHAPEAVLRALGAAPAERPPSLSPKPPAPVAMVPTNGIGLGHAQRCAQIAGEMARQAPEAAAPIFAAFPSCMGLVKSFGFDVMPLIGRSAFHEQSYENDLANYLRLRALTEGARTLVFDGGYVFDSIYRTILENRLRGVWIRRGLWQAGQSNAVALDREKVFDRVIVPREAFDELNRSYSRGGHLREVGPIVQRSALDAEARRELRRALAERYGLAFERLAVTLLGGGVAADRAAQVQALCGIAERRDDILHLVVVWPGGRQEPAWFGWDRSRVVRTRHAGALVAAADLCVAAAGYNLFHEVLYNRVPTIFVPQTGPFMDDQRARALAASDRGLAGLAEPTELMRLDRTIARFLDGGEAEAVARRLAAADLPEPGNALAARTIMEVSDGDAGLHGDRVARLSTGGR